MRQDYKKQLAFFYNNSESPGSGERLRRRGAERATHKLRVQKNRYGKAAVSVSRPLNCSMRFALFTLTLSKVQFIIVSKYPGA
jgi:hypothetical protein